MSERAEREREKEGVAEAAAESEARAVLQPWSRGHDEPRSMAVSAKSTSKSFFSACWHG